MKFLLSLVVATLSMFFVSPFDEVQAAELPIAQYRKDVVSTTSTYEATSVQEIVMNVRHVATLVEYWAEHLRRADEKKVLFRSFVERKSSETTNTSDNHQNPVQVSEGDHPDHAEQHEEEMVEESPIMETPSVSYEDRCVEQASSYLQLILSPHGIAVPSVEFDPSLSSKAVFNWSAIVIRECVSNSVLAHEAGHYVHSLATAGWSAMARDSQLFCLGLSAETGRCEGGWLSDAGKTSEAAAAPGVEHAAHCIGSILGERGAYTQCPYADLQSLALERVQRAQVS